MKRAPIGIFDSGYGGLTVLKEIVKVLPEYDFLYLGDNARNPYGTRSFKVVYEYTLEAVKYLFSQNCHLIIIACNTASAKALRNIQQLDLPKIAPERRVLGVIRPSVEKVAEITKNGHVGVLGTVGTVTSESYPIELQKWSGGKVKSTVQEACPMWVPIVENNEIETEGAEYFIKKNIENILVKDKEIDTLILGCTHYPLLINSIQKYVSKGIRVLEQGEIVAEKLIDYLARHPEIDSKISKNATIEFQTTEVANNFEEKAALFLEKEVSAYTIHL
ncbi:glutamate racemase [Maribellus comscasis]|uniref:Glutamate racemase n=1 Tax=Maribellus comscasis TaxID=2681766 RepID=A0A6I6JW22_9BACT|nr:glutamate racemase [Maribellus comscasis]QGY45499.1 glutamate racemase [Maribellus comscasis]